MTTAEIPSLSYRALLAHLGLYGVMEPDTEELMQELNERAWREKDFARGQLWGSSFHASSFPGDSPDACPRFLAYQMMSFAPKEAMPPWVTACGSVGKAVELDIARAWYEGGRLLAVPEDILGEGAQLVFEWPEHWLTGSVDLPILKRGWDRPVIVEIKAKDQKVVDEMREGKRRWQEDHRRQVLTSLALARRHDWGKVVLCEQTWRIARVPSSNPFLRNGDEPEFSCRVHGGEDCLIEVELSPPDSCSLYYCSRAWPRQTVEYFFEHDEEHMQRGLEVIDSVRESFEADEIPARPDGFQWSTGSCKYCAYKPFCRDDYGRKKADTPVTTLSESNGVAHTKSVRPDYDPQEARQAVIGRWSNGSGS